MFTTLITSLNIFNAWMSKRVWLEIKKYGRGDLKYKKNIFQILNVTAILMGNIFPSLNEL